MEFSKVIYVIGEFTLSCFSILEIYAGIYSGISKLCNFTLINCISVILC